MPSPVSVSWLLFAPLLAAGLFVPGWLLGRACRTPAGFIGAFLGSAALLLNLVLVLDALRLALTVVNLTFGLGLICAVLALLASRLPPSSPAPSPAPAPFRWQRHHWFFLPAALGLGALTLRATLDPLSGFDTLFRWDFLAQQMLREGSLHFYPPVTSDDFLRYGWPDGIAPLVSTLYLWSYLSAGHIAPWLTAPIVLAQAVLLFVAVWQLTARHDRLAATVAVAVLATSSVLLWGVAMGQETGLTALSLVAMFLFLERHRTDPSARWLLWAGVAAGTGALAREYGLAYLGLGLVTLAWWRVAPRRWLEFVLAAALVALPWYLRNWVKTGHPLYSHSLGGLFPVNPVLAEYNQLLAAQFSPGAPDSTWLRLAALAFGLGGPPLALGLLGGLTHWRARAPWLMALLAIAALWLWSIAQTSAGPGYAVRLLTPAVALGAVLGALWLTRLAASRVGWLLLALLTALSLDAALRSLYLPVEAEVNWWTRDAQAWREFDRDGARWRAHANWAAIAQAADGHGILAPDPTTHALFAQLGAKPVPLFSPAVRFLFAPDADYASCLARLRTGRMRFILLTRHSDLNDLQAARHPFFRALRASAPTATFSHYFIYDLAAPAR